MTPLKPRCFHMGSSILYPKVPQLSIPVVFWAFIVQCIRVGSV